MEAATELPKKGAADARAYSTQVRVLMLQRNICTRYAALDCFALLQAIKVCLIRRAVGDVSCESSATGQYINWAISSAYLGTATIEQTSVSIALLANCPTAQAPTGWLSLQISLNAVDAKLRCNRMFSEVA